MTTFRISWLLVLGMWVWAWLTWSFAPDRVPVHFGLSGEPTSWGPRSPLSWFGLPAMATLLTLGMGFLARWSVARPDRLSLPGRDRLAGLPADYLGPVRQAVWQITGWATLEAVALLALVQGGTVQGALGADTRVVIGLVFALALVGSPFLIGLALTRSRRAIAEAVRQAELAGALDATAPSGPEGDPPSPPATPEGPRP